MIFRGDGDLLKTPADALVNTVNTVGVMGKGIALQFKLAFPDKKHWKGKSKMEDIESGLKALIQVVKKEHIKSIAVPPLGCGNGGLDWEQVRPLIEEAFLELPDVQVQLFYPDGAPKAEDMKIATKPPRMTPGRAVILEVLSRYVLPGYRLTLLEIQKLAYF